MNWLICALFRPAPPRGFSPSPRPAPWIFTFAPPRPAPRNKRPPRTSLYSCFRVTSKWEREERKTLGRTSYRLENMYLKELTLLNQKFPQDLSHHEIFIAATASKYMFPQIDDLPLSVSIVTPNKFQIYPNLFPDT